MGKAYPVCGETEIPPGQRKIVEIAGRSIGIFNVTGRFHALKNVCPHQGAQLCQGTLKGITSLDEKGRPSLEREGEIIRCPWHGWEFEIATGRSLFNPERLRVKTYPVTLEEEPQQPSQVEPEEEVKFAEIYPVSVEEGIVTVHL